MYYYATVTSDFLFRVKITGTENGGPNNYESSELTAEACLTEQSGK